MPRFLTLSLLAIFATSAAAGEPPRLARDAAAHAVDRYDADQVKLLAELVRFKTVHEEGVPNTENPEFQAFTDFLRQQAEAFGLDFTSLGPVLVIGLGEGDDRRPVLVIGLGEGDDRLGIVTHGDVQPADRAKWRKSPFELDRESEPGRLIARGTEDDKAPIVTALYAMKTIKELDLALSRRIELIVSLTEESDWEPFLQVLENWEPPAVNIAIDSEYPVVVAEKGWGGLWVTFESGASRDESGPRVTSYEGGAFISQVPEDATIKVAGADASLIERVRRRAEATPEGARVTLDSSGDVLTLRVRGRAAHSMVPEEGVNALAHAAALLEGEDLAPSAPGRAIAFVNDLVGTGVHGKHFGDIAYEHPFMGPLTVNLSTAESTVDSAKLAINLRAPAGKSAEQLDRELRQAIAAWSGETPGPAPAIESDLNDAYFPERPPQVGPLLAVYRHYTGDADAEPVSIGGGTNARLLPNGINFGPSMPGQPYTGHSEYEFISREQMTLNLRMYTAMMAWMATAETLQPELESGP